MLRQAVLELDEGGISSSQQFDYVFGGASGTDEIYRGVGEGLVRRGLEGFNGTLLAYGQTASGKTHTLMGSPEEPGIIPRAVFGVFDAIAEANYSNVVVRVSYIEVYNEELRDLFASSESEGVREGVRGGLRIVDDPKTGPWVRGAVAAVARDADHVMGLLEFGEAQRAYGETAMNDHSSRSHVLFRITITRGFAAHDAPPPTNEALVSEQGPAWEQDPSVAVRVSSVNFVDLAGSERLKKTGATGQALKEANHINTSLMTLVFVILSLSLSASCCYARRSIEPASLLSGQRRERPRRRR
jgi:centromeric protein E